MNEQSVLTDWLAQFIRRETLFLRHFIGQVMTVGDPTQAKGVVNVIIQEIQNIIPTLIPCAPRQNSGLTVPNIGDYVEVYFMNGKPDRAVYLYPATEMQLMENKAATLDPKLDVIYCSPDSAADAITFQRVSEQLNILGQILIDKAAATITMLSGTEAFVLGTTCKTELQKIVDQLTQLNSDFSTWTPVPNDGGAALKTKVSAGFLLKPQAVLTSILSTVIMGK